MKPGLSALVLCASLACAGRAWVTTLPDSRGDDNVKFDVKTEARQPLSAGSAEGKSAIVFIENQNKTKTNDHPIPRCDSPLRYERNLSGCQQGRFMFRVDSGPWSTPPLRKLAIGPRNVEEEC
jgi:hypothetical protein